MQRNTMSGGVAQAIERLKQRITEFLPDVHAMDKAELELVFVVYADLIVPNFVPWMAKAWTMTRSPIARDACYDNLKCEVNDDHPLMLRKLVFGLSLGKINWAVLAAAMRLRDGQRVTRTITERLDHSSVYGLMLMAALENASLVFIPWMKQAADRLEIENRQYLEVHGEADVDHATTFITATEAEMKSVPQKAVAETEKAENDTVALLQIIFTREVAVDI